MYADERINRIRERHTDAIKNRDIEEVNQILADLREIGTPDAEAVSLHIRATVAKIQGDIDSAFSLLGDAISLHKKNGNKFGYGKSLRYLATLHSVKGNFESALEALRMCQEEFQALESWEDYWSAATSVAGVFIEVGEYARALELYRKALEFQQTLPDKTEVATTLGNLAIIRHRLGEYDAAVKLFEESIQIYEDANDFNAMASIYLNLSNVLEESKGFEGAIDSLDKAIHYDNLGGGSHVTELAIGNKVYTYIKLDRVQEARETFDTWPKTMHSEVRRDLQRFAYEGMLLGAEGDHERARAILLEALDRATDLGMPEHVLTIHRSLRDLAKSTNDLDSYIKHNDIASKMDEELHGKKLALSVAMQEQERELEQERQEHERERAVLHSALPKHVVDRVASGEIVNDHHENASVIFLDIVGFTTLSDSIPSGHVVHLLEQIFSTLDDVCDSHDVTKIKTIGDSYMAVSFESPLNAAACAIAMMTALDELSVTMPPTLGDTSWVENMPDIQVRIGIHNGPVTAGVIGTKRMQYDVWGDTVNTASRMESTGEAGRIHCSDSFASTIGPDSNDVGSSALRAKDDRRFVVSERGEIDIKGKGPMTTYWLEGA